MPKLSYLVQYRISVAMGYCCVPVHALAATAPLSCSHHRGPYLYHVLSLNDRSYSQVVAAPPSCTLA
jgi:hypothetical protein